MRLFPKIVARNVADMKSMVEFGEVFRRPHRSSLGSRSPAGVLAAGKDGVTYWNWSMAVTDNSACIGRLNIQWH